MTERSSEIVKAISLETGKNVNESLAEVNEAIHMVQYTFSQGREQVGKILASEIAEKEIMVFKKPKGVVGIISPWNFPFAINYWTSAPALLEGNTVVIKPSEETPYVGQLIAEMYSQAGFPDGVVNVIHGKGEHTGAELVRSDIDHVCFTCSPEVGRIIRSICNESWNKSCSCEMGSKSAVIIFDDANLDVAVKACIASAFKLSGQRCVSAGRLLVQRTILDKFTNLFLEAAKKLTVGNPFTIPAPDYGPLINKSQVVKVLKYNKMTLTAPKTTILLEGQQNDNCLTPHIYISEWQEHSEQVAFLREEVFGPHVAIIPFETPEDAVRIYNDTEYGLSMATITNNMHIAKYMRDNCNFGLGYLNLGTIGSESHVPFQGCKKSGYGGGSAAGTFLATTNEVTYTTNYSDRLKWAQGLK